MNTTTARAAAGDLVSGNYFGQGFTGQVVGNTDEWIQVELDAPIDGRCSIAMHRVHDAKHIAVVSKFTGETVYGVRGTGAVRSVEQLRARFATVRAWVKIPANAFELACIESFGSRPTTGKCWVRAAEGACEKMLRA